jgi:hypothetical protein
MLCLRPRFGKGEIDAAVRREEKLLLVTPLRGAIATKQSISPRDET